MKRKNLLISLFLFCCLGSCQPWQNQPNKASLVQQQNFGQVIVKINSNTFTKNAGFHTKNLDFSNPLIKKLKLNVFGKGLASPISLTNNWEAGQTVTFN